MRAELLIGSTFVFLLPTTIGLRGLGGLTDPWGDDALEDPWADDALEDLLADRDDALEDPAGLGSPGFMIFALFIVLRSVLWKVLPLKSWPCYAIPGGLIRK